MKPGFGFNQGPNPERIQWDPRKVSGLVLDLDPSLGVTLAVAKVSAWIDQSSNAIVASQSTDANRPTFDASGARPKITGAATARLDIAGMSTPTAATIFVALTGDTLNTAYLLSGAGGGFGIIQHFSGSALEWFAGSGTDRLTFSASPSVGAHLLSVTQTNGSALTLYYDGAQVATKAIAAANLVAFESIFNVTGGTSNGFNGSLLRLCVYNRVFGATELAEAHQHFKNWYL